MGSGSGFFRLMGSLDLEAEGLRSEGLDSMSMAMVMGKCRLLLWAKELVLMFSAHGFCIYIHIYMEVKRKYFYILSII